MEGVTREEREQTPSIELAFVARVPKDYAPINYNLGVSSLLFDKPIILIPLL